MNRSLHRLVVCLAAVAGVVVCADSAVAQSGTTALVMDSQWGDWIGEGEQRTYTLADGTFSVSRNGQNGVSLSVIEPAYEFWWYLDFGGAGEVPLTVGSYRNAHRYPFNNLNGLDISGNGSGCNRLTGRFDVLEAV